MMLAIQILAWTVVGGGYAVVLCCLVYMLWRVSTGHNSP